MLNKKIFILGFFLWLTVFLISFIIFPIKKDNVEFFNTLINLILIISTVIFIYIYSKNITTNYFKDYLFTGIIWMLISMFFDLLVFTWGPMQTPILQYFENIGLSYISIPCISGLIGIILSKTNIKIDEK